MKRSLNSHHIITSDPVLWYAYVIQDPVSAEEFASPSTKRTKCVGVRQPNKNRNYIFLYNIPKKEAFANTVDIWKKFITEPYEAYANFLQNFLLTKDPDTPFINDDTSFISKGMYDLPWLIYVHVLVMGVYGGKRNFYACKDSASADTTTTDALVAGKTCLDYRALLENVSGSPFPLTIKSGVMDESVMERLANAHLELMRKNVAFTFEDGIIDLNYKDTLNSTCPVQYGWVFGNEKLSKCVGWISTITQELTIKSTRNRDVLDPELGVFRRILHYMDQNLEATNALKAFVRKFEPAVVNIGAQVDGNPNQNIAVDLHKYGSDKHIFTSKSTKDDFLSKDPDYRVPMEKYFEGDWHPDNVFGKYLVYNREDKLYEVRDCFQIDIDNAIVSNMLAVPPERAPSGSSTSSSSNSQKSFDPENPPRSPLFPEIGDRWKSGQTTKNRPVSNTMQTVNELVDTLVDSDKRVEGGLGAILRELNDFATVDDMNTEKRKEKMTEWTVKIQEMHDDLTQQKGMMQTVIDGLQVEVKNGNEKAKNDKYAFEALMKTVRDEKAQVDQDLASALLRENALQTEKNDMDTNMQSLKKERDALEAQVAKLTQELQDSQKKTAGDVESIRKLEEKVAALEAKIADLEQKIVDNETENKKLVAIDASKQAELDTLAAKENELKDALAMVDQLKIDKQQLEVEKQSLQKLLSQDATDSLKLQNEKVALTKDIDALKVKIQEYEDQLKEIIDKLSKGIREHDSQMTTRIWKIHENIDTSIQKELTESELLTLLKRRDYMGFMKAVKHKPEEIEKKDYKLPALFLIYESIGGTWKSFEDLADKTQTTEFMAAKLMHVIRLFQTIETHDNKIYQTYTNKYFDKFLEVFELRAGDGSSSKFIIEHIT